MIRAEGRYWVNTHRISDCVLDTTVTTLNDGQWLMQNTAGNWIISDGTKKSFLTISAKWGNPVNQIGKPINAPIQGWDNVTPHGMVVVLAGSYRLETDQYDTAATYLMGDPLIVNGVGKLTKYVAPVGATNADIVAAAQASYKIVGHVTRLPVNTADTIGFIHE